MFLSLSFSHFLAGCFRYVSVQTVYKVMGQYSRQMAISVILRFIMRMCWLFGRALSVVCIIESFVKF